MEKRQEKRLLLLQLREYRQSGAIPMHMPGHKRNPQAPYLQELGGALDITEIHGFDDLHAPEGILREAMDRAAAKWGSKQAYFLVNGSTCGILAAVYATVEKGGRVLMARNCHRSVYHAVELVGASPVYLIPEYSDECGMEGPISAASVKQALAENEDVSLLILTSPTYDGVISDIAEISAVTHDAGIPLLVDEAHGAHLDLSPYFTGGAVKGGADLVVQSLHKTLPSLTQTAVLHLCSDRIDPRRLSEALAIFETSSPSYLLMASIDECVNYVDDAVLLQWYNAIAENKILFSSLAKLHVLGPADVGWKLDPSKIYISTCGAGLTGVELAQILRETYRIEVEMAGAHAVLAMTGAGDTAASVGALAKALREIDAACVAAETAPLPLPPLPERVCGIYAARRATSENLPRAKAAGKISTEYIYAYPPGIPLVVPGERLSEAVLAYMDLLAESGVSLHSDAGAVPREYSVVDPMR